MTLTTDPTIFNSEIILYYDRIFYPKSRRYLIICVLRYSVVSQEGERGREPIERGENMWLRVVLIFEGLWILSCDVCNILVNEITQKSRRLSRLSDKTNHAMENGVALSFSLYFGRRANRKRVKNSQYWWCIPGNFVSCRLFRRLVEGSAFSKLAAFQNWNFVLKKRVE